MGVYYPANCIPKLDLNYKKIKRDLKKFEVIG
jgi:hypothetical protein